MNMAVWHHKVPLMLTTGNNQRPGAVCKRARWLLVSICLGLSLSGCSQQDSPAGTTASSKELEERKLRIKTLEAKMSEEALARKQRSIAILISENVPYIDHLPVIEIEAESTRRTTEEVATRAMALCIVAVKGEGVDQTTIDKLVHDYDLMSSFTPKEKAFIIDPHPSDNDRVQFAWRYEDYWVMLWALGFIDKLERPNAICDVKRAVTILRDNGRQGFLQKSKLRSQAEILDAADLIYRYHWSTDDARLKGKTAPAGLDAGVVIERHYALNWLIGYMGQAWDEISTDT
jgi:hypothetical protein